MSFEGVKGCNEKYFVTRHNSREEKENKLEIKECSNLSLP
jgi:hypothetical protein